MNDSDITTQFLSDYDKYLPIVNKIINKYSGTHSINKNAAKDWINAQPNESSKNAAKIIIDHTVYVTLKDTAKLTKKLIDTRYREIVTKNPDKKIYFIAGQSKKSNYWLSFLALSYIKEYRLKEPDFFCIRLEEALLNDRNNIYIYFDDMAYSGNQTFSLINEYITRTFSRTVPHYLGQRSFDAKKEEFKKEIENINTEKYEKNIKKENDFSEYWINQIESQTKRKEIMQRDLAIIESKTFDELHSSNYKDVSITTKDFFIRDTEDAKNSLQEYLDNFEFPNLYFLLVGINKNAYEKMTKIQYNIYKSYIIDTPFKVYYGEMFQTIEEMINENKFTEKDLFYMSYYFSPGLVPNVLIYFDHKIADEPSTFLRAYNYGFVVPKNYNIVNYYPRYNEKVKTNLRHQKDLAYVNLQYYRLFEKYYNTREPSVLQTDITLPIRFIPFISNCYNVNTIIESPLLQYINYYMFSSDEDLSLSSMNDPIPVPMFSFSKKEKKVVDPLDEKYLKIINKIEDSKVQFFNYYTEDIYYHILKMFSLRNTNIYINNDDNLIMGNYSNEPDLKIYNLKNLDLFISVCEFLISMREHRCELSFYKTKMEDFAPRNYDELEDDFLKNEVPIVWPWEDPFKYWRKKGGKKTYRKKNTLKKRKTNKNKNKNKK
jgi:hypothetical protein